MPVALQKQIELMVFGGLIVFFLIVEPHGLARLWQIAKEKLRLGRFRTETATGTWRCAMTHDESDRAARLARGVAVGRWPGRSLAQANEISFPSPVLPHRPLRPERHPIANGFIDYLNLLNTRDGGVNGVKLVWDECETQYEVERGVECYERLKSKADVAAWNPLSTGIAYA